jgi:hypothetical protein
MAKMASLDAEQREIPWEFEVWRRLAIISALVWISVIVGVITIVVVLLSQI